MNHKANALIQMIKNYRHSVLAFLSFALIFTIASARAQLEEFKLSTAEDVAIAFYKKAGYKPDFEEWTTKSEEYKEISVFNQKEFLDNNVLRLERKYASYDLNQDLLTFALKARIRFTTLMRSPSGNKMMEIELVEPRKYLSVSIGGNFFAVIVQGLPELPEYEIDQNTFLRIQKLFENIEDGSEIPVSVKLRLRVISVDATSPMQLESGYHWLMMAETASLSLWKGEAFLWEWRAPWHETPTERQIRLLFRE